MIRNLVSRARKALTATALGATLAFAPVPAHAFWDTKKAWNDLLQFAVKQVNAPGEFEIILGEVTRPEDGFALISALQIKDSDGVWFDASNLLIDWSPTALIRGRFNFDTMSAEQITILRAPIGRGDPPADEAPPVEFAWPRPPVPLSIDALKIDRLRIEGGLLPQDLEAKVEGGFSDIGDIQSAKLIVQRTDRPGDRIALTSRIDFDDLDIAIELKANEEPGGLVAQMGNLPPDQALELDLSAKGTPEKLPFELFADIGQIGIAKGKGIASWNGLITAQFTGTVEPGEETNPDWKRALGDAARIDVDFAETEKGTYRLKTLNIDSEAFELSGKGIVDTGGNAIDMAIDWEARDIAAFNQIIAPASVTELTGTARAIGKLTAPKLDVNATVAGLDASFGKAEKILLKIDSAPIDPAAGTVGKAQGFTFEASAKGLALADAGLQDALGSDPGFSGKGAFDGVANTVTLDTLNVDAKSITLDGEATYNIGAGKLDADLAGQARELGPFFRAAGLPIDGRAALDFKLVGLQGGTLDRLSLSAQMSDLSSTDRDIAAALGDEATLDLDLADSGGNTIRIERGVLDSEVLRAEATGSISIPNDTVDLDLDFDLRDAAAVTALIDPAKIGAAQGKASLKGTLSEPKISVNATARDFGFDAYSAESARIEGNVQYRKDRRAPFAMLAELDGVKTGDDDLDRVVGATPVIEANGLYDTATGLLSLSKTQIDLADAAIALTGDIHLKKRTLDVTYDLDAGDLNGFEALVGKPLAGSLDIAGNAKGPFALPFVTAKGSARGLRYDTYSVEAADLDIETLPNEEGATPFRVDVTATNPKTGDPDLDALIGENPVLKAKGTLNRTGPAITLEYLDADLATVKAKAEGNVDLGTQLMDLSFDVEAEKLDGLETLLGTRVAGAIAAKGTASGRFISPEVKATVDGAGLRYDTYSIGSITGDIDIEQSPDGFAPFNIDVDARDVKTGDSNLDTLLAGASTIKATGEFNQSAQQVRIESAAVKAAGADLALNGSIDIPAKTVDLSFDLAAEDLSPFEAFAGVPLGGSVKAAGTAKGSLPTPEIDVSLSGKELRYDAYSVAAIDGKIDVRQSETGFAPFDIDVKATGIETGDAALDDLLNGPATIRARGGFDQSAQQVRIESAAVKAAGADLALNGSIDIPAKTVDLSFDLAAEDLSPFEALAGVPLAGNVEVAGTAKGSLPTPEIDVSLSGKKLRYDAYSVAAIDGKIDVRQSETGFAPFDIDVKATGIKTGDAALDDLLNGPATIRAKGEFDQSKQRLRIESATLRAAGTNASLSGDVDIAAKTLDVAFDVEAADLSAFEPLAGAPLAGAATVRGTARGGFTKPELDVALAGKELRYDTYKARSLDGTIALGKPKDGYAPFDVNVKATGLSLGDPKLDEALRGGVKIDAAGGFDQGRQRLRLNRAKLLTDAATVDLAGTIDLKAKTLDVRFDVDADDLAVIGPLVGTDMGGAIATQGTAKGPFVLPSINAAIDGEKLRYGTYSVAALDGTVAMESTAKGFAPFDIDVTAHGIRTGDPKLDDIIGGNVTVDAAGGFDRVNQIVQLDKASLDSGFATAKASGTVDLKAQELDVTFDLDAQRLAALEPLLGTDIAGSVALNGTAKGPFSLPAVDARLAGRDIVYDRYSVTRLNGHVDMGTGKGSNLPFDVDLMASGIGTGDPALDATLGKSVSVKARGAFDRDAQLLRLDTTALDAEFAMAQASGTVNLAAKTLDIAFDLDAERLSAFGPVAKADIGGSLKAKGTAKGPFVIPAVDVTIDGQAIRYQQYSIGRLAGKIDLGNAVNGGGLPFDIDVAASGIATGDPALDATLGENVSVKARGDFDQDAQKLRLDTATLDAEFAMAQASGTVDLAAKTLDIAFDLDAERLSAFGPVAKADIGGSLKAKGTAKGPFVIPAVDVTIDGQAIRYQQYSIGRLAGKIDLGNAVNGGGLPFDIDVAASGIVTGDPALDATLGENVSVKARGDFDQDAQKLRLDTAALDTEFATAQASGTVDLAAKTLDIAFDLDAERLSAFGPVAKADIGGSLKAKGTAKGPFVIPAVDVTIDGQAIRYQQYSIGRLAGKIDLGNAVNGGGLPFDIDVAASGIATGDPALDAAIGETVQIDATGTFDQDEQIVTLDTARFDSASANANAQGAINLKAQTLDVAFDLTAADLGPFSAIAGAPVRGSVALRGAARGPFNLPAIDANLAARDLGFDAYGARVLDGAVSLGLPQDGYTPFTIDMMGEGLSLGDPALEAALGARIDINAAGAMDIAQKRIRLDRAALVSDAATVSASGNIDLTAKQLDIGFDVEAGNLNAFGPLAGADLGGAITMRGQATGPFVIPRVNADIAGTALRYQNYTIGRLTGNIGMDTAQNGVMPFNATLTAAGIGTGNPALDQALGGEVRVAAQGGFDQAAKRLTLGEATINSAVGQVSAQGAIDLNAKSLDIGFNVDAGEIASLSGLAGTDIAGSLAAGGRITGPFSAPSIATSLEGRSLRYAQYSIASLTGKVSFAAVPEGFGPFDIDATAAGINTGDPSLDFALEGGVSIAGKGGFDATNQRLQLDGLTAQARFATLAANGLVDIKTQMLDVNFTVDASDLSPLSGIIGKPVGGALRASGNARGGFKAPIVNMQAQGGGLYYDGYSLAGLSLDLKMPGDVPGYLPFTLTGNLSQPRLNNPQLENLIGETVNINAQGVFDPTRQLLRLTDTRVATANAGISAFGDIDLGNKLLDVKYYVDARDLSIAQPLAGKTLAGAARIRGRVSGALTDPTTIGQLTGQSIVYDTYRVTSVTAFYDLQRLTSGPAGSVALNAETELGPLTAKARFDLTGGVVRVEELAVNGLGVGLNGSFRTGPNGVLEGSATLAANDLGQIGAFIGQDIAGRVDGTINLNGDQGKQNAFFDVTGMNFRYGPQDNPTVQFASFAAKGQAFDALGTNPYVDATANGTEGKLAGFPVTGIDVTAKGPFSALDTTITGLGGALGSDRIEMVAKLNLVNPPRSAVVSRLALVYEGRQASIIEPLVAEEIVPGGFRIRNLDLRAEDGEVRGGIEYTQSGVVADLKIRNFPLALASLSGISVIRSGRLDGTVDVDTRNGVRGTFAFNASALRLNGAQIDDPFAVTAQGTMDGTALNVTAELNGPQLVQPLTARARIPLMSVAGSPLPVPNRSAPFSGQVDWQGDVGEIWSFVPLPDHILSGPVAINGRATGTLDTPVMSGGAVLTNGRYSNIEFGTLLTNLNAKANFTQDGRAVFDLTASDGVQGTVAASGSYLVASGTLDTRLSLNNAALVRRDDATAVLSGDATAVSEGRDIRVAGDFRTNFVEVRLIGNFGSSLTVVEAIPVGKSAPLYIPPAVENEASRKIFLDVSLSIPNRAFVRGRGLDSEWGGQLDVSGTASKPRIQGAIEKRRGVFDFLGKQFDLSIGTVRFTGDTSPFVQVRLQRESNDITGWIEVKGKAPDIGLEFGSIPALPEGEVLPRLLFGRSKQSLTALEAGQLAAGVATLLSGKAGVIDSVRDAVGVDVLRTESDVDGGTSIITGKYLRDEIFVGAKQNLQTGQTSGLVEIEVFDQFEIEAELGSEESRGSIGWQIEY